MDYCFNFFVILQCNINLNNGSNFKETVMKKLLNEELTLISRYQTISI